MGRFITAVRRAGPAFWLLLLAGILAVLLLSRAIGYARLGAIEVEVTPLGRAGSSERPEAEPVEHYSAIFDGGCFGEVRVEKPRLFGVLGAKALIGQSAERARFHAEGDDLDNDFRLVEVHAGSVVVERDGKRGTLTVWPEGGLTAQGVARPRAAAHRRPRRPQPESPPAPAEEEKPTPPPSRPRQVIRSREWPAHVPPEVREEMRRRMRERRERMGRNMPPQVREALRRAREE
ncbi:MAG: hypothetical protein R6V05_10465 [Candidatus Brocadiia bacterium]